MKYAIYPFCVVDYKALLWDENGSPIAIIVFKNCELLSIELIQKYYFCTRAILFPSTYHDGMCVCHDTREISLLQRIYKPTCYLLIEFDNQTKFS